jgi:hypothetical protein
MTAPTPPVTAAEYREAQRAEYGTYVALTSIDIDGARAFNAGDAVPVSHVERGVVASDLVAKTTTKAGREAAGIPDDSKKG